MNHFELKALMGAIAPVLKEFVAMEIAKAVTPMQEKIAALEARPELVDRGVWHEGSNYARGSAVSWSGSLWIAQVDTPGKPGEPESGWRLAVKRGRDGRDASR